GGLSVAPFSSSVSERGRWITQICPWASTVMPPTWPMIQLLGSGFGHEASTANVGMPSAAAGRGRMLKADAARQTAAALAKRSSERARRSIDVINSSHDFLGSRLLPLGRVVNRGDGMESTATAVIARSASDEAIQFGPSLRR